MRIAYIIEKLSGKGGMERILTDKMNYLASRTAHEVVLVLLWHDDKPLAYALHPKVRVLRLNCPCGFAPVGFAMMLWRFRKYIHNINPDITVYTWVAGAFLACYGGWKGKSIFENHHTLSSMKHSSIIRKASSKVDCVVALSVNDAQAFTEARRTDVIPNFTNIQPSGNNLSSKHCLAIGRLVDVKDYPRMVKIWKQVSAYHPDWILDIVGEGPEKDALLRMIDEEHLEHTVILHPTTNDIAHYYADSDIYLMTSKSEGLPMVLIEAQTCGLPAVAFDCDFGPRQIINDGVDGYLIPYDGDQMFIDKLSAIMDDEALRRQMGEAAKVASQRYQPAPIMEQWLKLFTELAGS